MAEKKIHCGKCNDCSPTTKKKVQEEKWTPVGQVPGYKDRMSIKNKEGKTRVCPTWALTDPKPINIDDVKAKEKEEEEQEEEQDDGSWIMNDGYGPKCDTCGAGKGEDHCASCPNKKWGCIPATC